MGGGGGILGKAVGAAGSLIKTAVNVSTLGLVKKGQVGNILDTLTGQVGGEVQPTIIQSAPAAAQGGPKAIKPLAQAETAPKPADAAIQAARKKQSRIAAAAGGRAGNILTSGQGLTTPARTTKKTLLGQ